MKHGGKRSGDPQQELRDSLIGAFDHAIDRMHGVKPPAQGASGGAAGGAASGGAAGAVHQPVTALFVRGRDGAAEVASAVYPQGQGITVTLQQLASTAAPQDVLHGATAFAVNVQISRSLTARQNISAEQAGTFDVKACLDEKRYPDGPVFYVSGGRIGSPSL